MIPRVFLLTGALLTLSLLGGAGCASVCDTYCEATVDTIEDLGCLTEWGVSWEDQNYESKEDYTAHCQAAYAAQLADASDLSADAAGEVRQECSDKLDDLDSADDCSVIAVADF
jgi:hypothetical protein